MWQLFDTLFGAGIFLARRPFNIMGKRKQVRQEAEESPNVSVYEVLKKFYIPKFDAFGVSDLRLFEIPKQH